MLKSRLNAMFTSAMDLNRRNLLEAMPHAPAGKLLDLGCDDGVWTLQIAKRMATESVYGVEIVKERAAEAEKKGIQVRIADLAQALPLESESFDVVHANQVIEHVPDIDLFASEMYRVLRPGGWAVVSTENASSWHNVFAMALGWQMFSLTNLSDRKLGVGNPMALHRGESGHLKSWTHKVIFSYRGLREFFAAHGFEDISIKGAGYYPLPASFGKLDPRHAHFITIKARRPER